ncbi:mannose-6-phosphate isomerase, class I [Microbacterium sp. A204]|uniref:mannose-6-phosphate isomerase, class I n=1 Tax=Microbacterium sp. A204 TaxID=3457321 RepID=UPI003FCF40E7
MFYLLEPSQKDYAWGSRHAIQEVTGFGVVGEPLAEIWYGAHPSGPSRLEDGRTLDELIRADGAVVLGGDIAGRFDGTLPFLVKLLAPCQAVSVQVHPNADRAREGYAAQLADPASEKKFVDAHHKPEQIFALTTFEGLVGLRPIDEAADALALIDHPLTRAARADLGSGDDIGVRRALTRLASASPEDVDELVALARKHPHEADGSPITTVLELAQQYPGDAGVAVSMMLCRVRLNPGESVMVDSGVPHAYMSGLALEVMANSDNVFRLGLTVKKVDVGESVANVLTTPAKVQRPHGSDPSAHADAPAEFALTIHDLAAGRHVISGSGPRVVVSLSDDCTISDESRRITLPRGAAAFLPHGSTATAIAPAGQLAVIVVPDGRSR